MLLCLLGAARFVVPSGNLVRGAPGPQQHPPPQNRPRTPLPSPAALFYLHHLRSCALSACRGAVGGGVGCLCSGAGVCLQCLGAVVGWVCHLVHSGCSVLAHLVEWGGRGQGCAVLLAADASFLSPRRPTTLVALLVVLGKICKFHRPPQQCRLLSGLVTGFLVCGWASWVWKAVFLVWAWRNPLFPLQQPQAMEVDPSPPTRFPASLEPWRKNFGPSSGTTCRLRNYCVRMLGDTRTLVRFLAVAAITLVIALGGELLVASGPMLTNIYLGNWWGAPMTIGSR